VDSAEWAYRKAARVMSAAYNKFPDRDSAVDASKGGFDGVCTLTYIGLWHGIDDNLHQNHKDVRVLVAGGRDFHDYKRLCTHLDRYLATPVARLLPITIIGGGARGADTLGERYAKERGYLFEEYLPDWGKNGKSAGYIRNEEMAKALPTKCFCFWDGLSSGTEHMINLARKHEISTKVVEY